MKKRYFLPISIAVFAVLGSWLPEKWERMKREKKLESHRQVMRGMGEHLREENKKRGR